MNDLSDFTVSNTTGDYWIVEDADGITREIPKELAKDEGRVKALMAFWIPIEVQSYNDGHAQGYRKGRAEIVLTLQEVFGLDRLARSLDHIADTASGALNVLATRL